jgi:hypothetical protein
VIYPEIEGNYYFGYGWEGRQGVLMSVMRVGLSNNYDEQIGV